MTMRSAVLLTCAAIVAGQVASPGKPFRHAAPKAVNFADVRVPDVEALLAGEANSTDKSIVIADVIEKKITLSEFSAVKTADGTVHTLGLRSPGAFNIQVNFADYVLPEGAELFVFTNETVRGAFTSSNNKEGGEMAVWPLAGDALTVELYVPTGAEAKLTIGSIAHHYKKGFGHSGSCNINSACDEESADQYRSVALTLNDQGRRSCSGTLIANEGYKMYLATASHCRGAAADGALFMFNYKSATCENPASEPSTADQTAHGATNLYARPVSNTDVSILEINEEIPESYNLFFSPFSAESEPEEWFGAFAISHPATDIQKIAYASEEVPTIPGPYSSSENTHWRVDHWATGTTEQGSSGSGLWNGEGEIVGVLSGGTASCQNTAGWDAYGAFAVSWEDGLKEVIAPNTGGKVFAGKNVNGKQ